MQKTWPEEMVEDSKVQQASAEALASGNNDFNDGGAVADQEMASAAQEPDELEQLMMVDGGNANGNGNKENGSMGCGNFSNSATASMIELCEEKQISVRRKVDGENVPITNGQQAFFALLSQDMNNLADRYDAEYADCLKIFYEVNCDR